jgi:hypothetical protein
MKKLITAIASIFLAMAAFTQVNNAISIQFKNDYKDVYHLSLIIYKPDGKSETRVSDVQPGDIKKYSFPVATEVFIADWEQEAYAMKGNDIKTTGVKPFIVLKSTDNNKVISLSEVSAQRNIKTAIKKPDANDALGTWVIDLRPTPESEPYIKEFKFTKIEGQKFDGEFYGYPFSGGFLNTSWDKIYFAFTTSDQSSQYFHSGYIEGNKVFGITLNEKREFVLPWRGEKK